MRRVHGQHDHMAGEHWGGYGTYKSGLPGAKTPRRISLFEIAASVSIYGVVGLLAIGLITMLVVHSYV